MALMSDIVTDVLDELRYGSGQDVQIHLQTGIVKNASRLYRTLMKKYTWRDYVSISAQTTVVATGQSPVDLTDYVTKFSNVIAVYNGNENDPLPVARITENPARFHRPAVVPVSGAKVFAIYPFQDRDITLVAKKYSEDDFALTAEVPFYRDLLSVGTAYMLSVKAGTNDVLTRELKSQFDQLLDIHLIDQMPDSVQLNVYRGVFPMEWYESAR